MFFDNFSAQSFERLIQALSVNVLGPGIVVFGAGPDGGREATFEGTVPFPSLEARWNGYIVIQAKCKEVPKGDARDASWLITQLKAEFGKYQKNKRLRRPEYYIIATNVTLSPEAKNGGRAKVERLIEQYQKKLKFKAAAIWAADDLRALLENARDVRISYSAWLTPGDVLAELIDLIARPKLKDVLPLALARDLRQERDIRLRDAGQETEKPVYLHDLFVDLPFLHEVHVEKGKPEDGDEEDEAEEPFQNSDERKESAPKIVAEILRRAADKLDSEAISCHPRPDKGRSLPLPNRIVILGGPGQGKSTLGQFLAQVARARLLSQHSSAQLNPQTADLVFPVLERARIEGLPLNGPARFPIRVDLPLYADALQKAGGNGVSLIAFMAARLSRDVDQAISATDLRHWLSSCPALIILDGLDEVPPSGNRAQLIKSIDALWDDLSLAKSDALVVVTTRPQGYNDDLSSQYWQHWELSPLTAPNALNFARRLSEVRLSDPDRREAIIAELTRAANDASTMLLLTTPLQVTILFGISLLKGAIPQDRWELFERYYTLLRDREAQKTSSDAQLIRDYKRQIDTVHYQAGFILHVISEVAGAANPHLSVEQFRALVVRLLSEEEYTPEEVSSISEQLVRIATERLVLLACRVEGRIAFDVRSLQEFMAAAQIAAFSTTVVVQRLRAIALSAHWQHVFRIAASKIFSVAELSPLRSEVVAICHALDNGDQGEDGRLVRSGARLALELLHDGLAHTAPVFRRNLVRRALSVLDIGPDMLDPRLKLQLVSGTANVFHEELTSRLSQGNTPAAKAAWALTSELLDVDPAFSESIMLAHWPSDPNRVLETVDVMTGTWTSRLIEEIKLAQAEAGPRATHRFIDDIEWYDEDEPPSVTLEKMLRFSVLPSGFLNNRLTERVAIRDRSGHVVSNSAFVPLGEAPAYVICPDLQARPNWAAYLALATFVSKPSATSLARMLRQMAVCGREGLPTQGLPWICVSILAELQDGASAELLAQEVEDGKFGDLDDWKAAEERWIEKGAYPGDFEPWASGRYFNASVGSKGLAYLNVLRPFGRDTGPFKYDDFTVVLRGIQSEQKKIRLLEILISNMRHRSSDALPQGARELIEEAIDLVAEHQRLKVARLFSYLLRALGAWERDKFVDLVDEAGLRGARQFAPTPLVAAAFNRDPRRRGLLPFLRVGPGTGFQAAISRLDGSAFTALPSDPPSVRHAVALLRLGRNSWGEKDVPELLRDLNWAPGELHIPPSAIPDLRKHPDYPSFLRALCLRPVGEPIVLHAPLRLLAYDLGARPSPLTKQSKRAELELPDFPNKS
ncbi:MAG: hypothetical protein HY852_07690 [Bradyrhizobium sp.]|uniref:NACHT domain-containing protein n=1 Tax=Bradyrhizobium sp. TaxID=376 RepID=UPI0025C34BEC|nr:hypothetical protein [Bradyrhizobium sp.]MBI5261685.1 hypothetical protein [Bradyrhizobium sp.]